LAKRMRGFLPRGGQPLGKLRPLRLQGRDPLAYGGAKSVSIHVRGRVSQFGVDASKLAGEHGGFVRGAVPVENLVRVDLAQPAEHGALKHLGGEGAASPLALAALPGGFVHEDADFFGVALGGVPNAADVAVTKKGVLEDVR